MTLVTTQLAVENLLNKFCLLIKVQNLRHDYFRVGGNTKVPEALTKLKAANNKDRNVEKNLFTASPLVKRL